MYIFHHSGSNIDDHPRTNEAKLGTRDYIGQLDNHSIYQVIIIRPEYYLLINYWTYKPLLSEKDLQVTSLCYYQSY